MAVRDSAKDLKFCAGALDDLRAFRVLYMAKLSETVYVLHCFQKKTQTTSKVDLDLAAKRYRGLVKELDR